MSIKAVMTRNVKTVSCHSSLEEAAKLMREGHVGDTMIQKLVTVRDYEGVSQVLRKMREYGVRRAPVLNSVGILVGIVSVEDIFNQLVDNIGTLADITRRQKVFEIQRRHAPI